MVFYSGYYPFMSTVVTGMAFRGCCGVSVRSVFAAVAGEEVFSAALSTALILKTLTWKVSACRHAACSFEAPVPFPVGFESGFAVPEEVEAPEIPPFLRGGPGFERLWRP